ncbi:hypothetical protein FS837_007480, partial [Tulasnella sp. UAMH 9824]
MSASSRSGILSTTISLLKNALESQDSSTPQTDANLPESNSTQREIDENIAAMWTALNALRSQIAQAATQRNSLSAISQLPSEITIEIFQIALDSRNLGSGDSSYYERLQTIASVSTVWRNIILQTPSLWSRVEISESWRPFPLATSLKRANNMPLDVSCHGNRLSTQLFHGQEESLRLKPLADELAVARLHLPRWRSFGLDTRCPVTAQDLLSVHAPNVEKVQVTFEWERIIGGWEEPVTLFSGHAERLTEVIIEGMPLCFTRNRLTGLRVLDLREIHRSRWALSLPTILRTLENCPELEVLSLIECYVAEVSEDQDLEMGGQTIELLKLQSIALEHVSSAAGHSILQSIQAPSLSHFSLVHMSSISPIPSLSTSLMTHINAIQRTIIDSDTFEVSICGQKVSISAAHGETTNFQLEVVPAVDELAELLAWLADNLPLPRLAKSVDVSLTPPPEIINGFHDTMYRWLPSVTSLTLDQDSQPRIMLKRLSKCVQEPGGEVSWLWPNLQSLCITGDPEISAAAVLAFLRGRTQSVESESSPASSSSTHENEGRAD